MLPVLAQHAYMLIAQTRAENVVLVTRNATVRNYRVETIWSRNPNWNAVS